MLGDNGTVLEGLMGDDNFLPDSYRISMTDLSLYDETVAQITSIEGVEKNYRLFRYRKSADTA